MEASAVQRDAELSPLTRLGAVHLTVSDLERSISYYRDAVGPEAVGQGNRRASLGRGGRVLLVLVEEAGARSAAGYTGLYHFALLVPQRTDLARWLAHAARDRVPLLGLSEHFVSEALYLSDPDGHGIEIYWDWPREQWEGQVAARMTTPRLDVDDLLGALDNPETEPFDGLASETVMGHVHLKVADVPETIGFYRDVLGFALMAQLGPQAAFLSAATSPYNRLVARVARHQNSRRLLDDRALRVQSKTPPLEQLAAHEIVAGTPTSTPCARTSTIELGPPAGRHRTSKGLDVLGRDGRVDEITTVKQTLGVGSPRRTGSVNS